MKHKISLALLFMAVQSLSAQRQVIEHPIAAEQSHPELSITKISFYNDSTVLQLTVENKLAQGGWFCADRNTYLESPSSGRRYSLLLTKGIPECPSVHSFKRLGEKLSFKLYFPGIPNPGRLINLVEDCTKSCFSFTGIILDPKLTQDIRLYNKGIELYAANQLAEAVGCFLAVVRDIPAFPTHAYGYSYYNLVRIHFDQNDLHSARYWLDQLEKSALPDKTYFIETLKKEGIYAKL